MGSCSGLSLVASRRAPQRRSRSGTEVGSAAQGGSVDRRAEPAGRRGVCSCGDSAGPPVQAATGRVAGGTPVARAYWAGLAVAGGGHRCDGSSSRRALRAGAGRRRGGDHSGDRGDLGAGRTFPASTLGGVVPTRGTAGRIEVRLHACAHDGGFVSARLRLAVLPPFFSLALQNPQDPMIVLISAVTAGIVSVLAKRARQRAREVKTLAESRPRYDGSPHWYPSRAASGGVCGGGRGGWAHNYLWGVMIAGHATGCCREASRPGWPLSLSWSAPRSPTPRQKAQLIVSRADRRHRRCDPPPH